MLDRNALISHPKADGPGQHLSDDGGLRCGAGQGLDIGKCRPGEEANDKQEEGAHVRMLTPRRAMWKSQAK